MHAKAYPHNWKRNLAQIFATLTTTNSVPETEGDDAVQESIYLGLHPQSLAQIASFESAPQKAVSFRTGISDSHTMLAASAYAKSRLDVSDSSPSIISSYITANAS